MQDVEVTKTKTPKNTSSPTIVSSFHDINLPTEERYFLQSLVENMRGLLRKRGSSGFFADVSISLVSCGNDQGFLVGWVEFAGHITPFLCILPATISP